MKKIPFMRVIDLKNNEKILAQSVSFCLVMTLFFLPLSPSLKSIFIVLSAIAILLIPSYRKDLQSAFSQPWAKAVVLFFLIVVAACFWSPAAYHIQFVFIEKYSKLLLLPIFVIGFRDRSTRMMGIYAFITAMLITCVLSIYKDSYDPGSFPEHDPGKIVHNHIITGYMMVFAVYLSGLQVVREQGYKRMAFLFVMLLLSYQALFVNTGRASQVLYFVLILMLFIQTLPAKKLLIAVLCFATIFTVCSFESTVLTRGFNNIISDIHSYQKGDNKTSVGYRITFHLFAKNLFVKNPWIGTGTGGFATAFNQDNTLPEWKNLLDPHSQYWLIAADFGLLGLMALLVFYATLFKSTTRLHEMKPILLGLLISFIIANGSDSLLFYSAIGYLFILFTALTLGELSGSKPERNVV